MTEMLIATSNAGHYLHLRALSISLTNAVILASSICGGNSGWLPGAADAR